jgi:hypothetical protein
MQDRDNQQQVGMRIEDLLLYIVDPYHLKILVVGATAFPNKTAARATVLVVLSSLRNRPST